MGTNSARSSPGSQRPSSDSDTNVVDSQLLRKPPGLGSGCNRGSKSSKFLAHHSLCPSALRLKEPEGEKTETQKGQDFSQERGAKRTGWTGAPSWLGWVSCPPPIYAQFPTCRDVGGGSSRPDPAPSVPIGGRKGRGVLTVVSTRSGCWELRFVLDTHSFTPAGRSSGSMATTSCVCLRCVPTWQHIRVIKDTPSGAPSHPRFLCQVSSWMGQPRPLLPAPSCSRHGTHPADLAAHVLSARPSFQLWGMAVTVIPVLSLQTSHLWQETDKEQEIKATLETTSENEACRGEI